MRAAFKTLVITTLAACLATASLATKLDQPRELRTPTGYFPREHAATVAPLGLGNPSRFAMGDAWLTSDYELYWDSTDIEWYDTEYLQIFGAFYSATDKNTTTIVDVFSQSGASVYHSSFTDPALPGEINGYITDIGVLPAGNYKVSIKFKQGTVVLGQKFWFTVLVDTPPVVPQP